MGRTPIARVMDCRHFDIGRRTAKPQVRPRTQSTTTGGLGKHLRFSDDDIAQIMAEGARQPVTRGRGTRR